jgi:hypothetical protein
VVEREAEGERKEDKEVWGRKWWTMLSSQKKRMWHRDRIVVPAWYKR